MLFYFNILNTINGIELFVFMFISFLIGYFFGIRNHKGNQKAISTSKKAKKIDINEIETIFSEIKPEIIKIIEKHKSQEETGEEKSPKPFFNLKSLGLAEDLEKDELTKIEGISPFLEVKLNDLGIFSFTQISRFTENDIEQITQLIEYFPGRIQRDNWVRQAKALENKKATHAE